MAKPNRQGQVLMETIIFVFLCVALVTAFQLHEGKVLRKQKTYRWEK